MAHFNYAKLTTLLWLIYLYLLEMALARFVLYGQPSVTAVALPPTSAATLFHFVRVRRLQAAQHRWASRWDVPNVRYDAFLFAPARLSRATSLPRR
jgi:hypothetical protein